MLRLYQDPAISFQIDPVPPEFCSDILFVEHAGWSQD